MNNMVKTNMGWFEKKGEVMVIENEIVGRKWIKSKDYGWIECGVVRMVKDYRGVRIEGKWLEEEGLGFIHGYWEFNVGFGQVLLNVKDNVELFIDEILEGRK